MSVMQVEVSRELPFPAERVWAVIEDFGDMRWADNPPVEVIGSGIGMIRRITMPGMAPIDEVLEGIDAGTRTLRYGIPRGLPMPLGDYHACARVEPLGEARCRVHWSARAVPQGIDAAQAEAILQGAYGQLLGWLESWLAKG